MKIKTEGHATKTRLDEENDKERLKDHPFGEEHHEIREGAREIISVDAEELSAKGS